MSDYMNPSNPNNKNRFAKLKAQMAAKKPEDPAADADVDPTEDADPAAAATPAAKVAAPKGGTGNSPTRTNTETGGSSPGGASTGGVGSGIGGAGTGGAATGGASTGGAGTVTVTISGSSSTETSSGAGAKKGKGKDSKPAGPITLNISNVGGTTKSEGVKSGDGPGALGTGGRGSGSGGGGGGASPDEPENYSTSNKDDSPEKMAKGGMALGGGGRFAKLKNMFANKPGITNPGALAASIGRKKYGQAKMTQMATAGKHRHEKK